jgi:hypothetical protein
MNLDSSASSLNKFLFSFYKCAIAGMAAFVGIHIFLVLTWDHLFSPSAGTEAWWLDTQGSMTLTLMMLFFATLAVLSLSSASNLAKVALALAMWVGILIGMWVVFVRLQSEPQLGPIPVVIGGVLALPPVILGMLAALGLTKLVRHVRQRPDGPTTG